MQWSPFLEIFIALFLALGVTLGWFTRVPVPVLGAVTWALVAGGLLLAEQAMDREPWNWDIGGDTLAIYALLGACAAVPALASALIGRALKRRYAS